MTKGWGRPDEAWKNARQRPGTTFHTLCGILAEMSGMEDGPEGWSMELCTYDNVRAADKLAYRIRHGKMKLPDVDGETNGKWAATVLQEDGKATVYVAYEGTVK